MNIIETSIKSPFQSMAQSASDRRRINGPEESFSPVFDDEEEGVKLKTQRSRAPSDIRPICECLALAHFC